MGRKRIEWEEEGKKRSRKNSTAPTPAHHTKREGIEVMVVEGSNEAVWW